MKGDRIAGTITVWTRLCQLTSCDAVAAIVAPITPPISAWLELDGIVKYQVIRFHVIAPISAARTSRSPSPPVSTAGLTIPFAIVAATLIEMNAPAKFRHAEMTTATIGLSAPVAIEVAIALAVSWKPFVKSNESPAITTRMRMSVRSHARAQPPRSC